MSIRSGQFLPIAIDAADLLRRGGRAAVGQPARGPAGRSCPACRGSSRCCASASWQAVEREGGIRAEAVRPGAGARQQGATSSRAAWLRTSASLDCRCSIVWCAARSAQRFGGRLKAMVSGGAPLELRGRPVLRGPRPAGGAGLRPDGGRARRSASTRPGQVEDRHGGPAARRASSCASPRTARSWSGATRDEGLLEGRAGDGAGARRRLAAHRRRRRDRRRRLSQDHRPQEGHDRQLGRRQRLAAAGRGRR